MIKELTRTTGIVMLLAALAITFILLITIVQVLFDPESVAAVKTISGFISSQFPLVVSDIKSKQDFIDIDPSGRLVIVYFVSALAVIAIASVLRTFVGGAIALLKFSSEYTGK